MEKSSHCLHLGTEEQLASRYAWQQHVVCSGEWGVRFEGGYLLVSWKLERVPITESKKRPKRNRKGRVRKCEGGEPRKKWKFHPLG
jgi:hypothetical protein